MELFSLAKRMDGIESSPTLRLNALAQELTKQGKDIVNLTAGETDFPTADSVKEACVAALQQDFTRYTPVHGIPELRESVSKWFREEWGIVYSAKQITTSLGAKQGLFNFLFAVINPGDEVIIPAPYWVSYPEMVRMMGGVPVFVQSDPSTGFTLDPNEIKKSITHKTRLLILNSPSNPSGAVIAPDVLKKIAACLEGTNILVASDEIYGKLCFLEGDFRSFAAISADAYKRTVTFNGLSKSHAMTGWRVGFAAGPEAIIDSMGIIQGQSATHMPSFIQRASIVALQEARQNLIDRKADLLSRRDVVLEILREEKRIRLLPPRGAFYLFPDLSEFFSTTTESGKIINGSDSLCEYLLESAGVATVPGRPFGEDRCIRISFSRDKQTLVKGCQRLVAALQKLKH